MKVVSHGSVLKGTFSTLEERLQPCPPLYDVLDWGPQHVNLAVQRLMRECYFNRPASDDEQIETYGQALEAGEQVLFWCDPTLANCLGILWTLDCLVTRGYELDRAYLVLLPGVSHSASLDPSAVLNAFEERVSVAELIEPLLAVRRHIASDSEEVKADLSELPPPIREWAGLTDLMVDFLPNERGLDIVDRLLLNSLTEEWERASRVIARCLEGIPRGHDFGDIRLWHRLLELSGDTPYHPRSGTDWEDALIEVRFDGEATWGRTRFRISPLGLRVRDKRTDAIKHRPWNRPFCRWVGGRMVTADRSLRRGRER